MSAEPPPFDVCGELPHGTTVLEASAGTGKTYAIAALAARYVAEGHAELSRLMMVTFGRMATDELRLRVRERLVCLEHCLAAARGGSPPGRPLDRLEAQLVAAPAEELARRHARVGRALSDFDAATIATTHEFCQRMLEGLGVLGDAEPQATFVEHLTELTGEVARDLYLQRYAQDGSAPMTFGEAERLAHAVVGSPHARLVPDDPGDAAGEVRERVAFGTAVRAEVQRRKQLGRLITYEDQLVRLRDALVDPRTGPAAARRLRERFSVVLVDEFQDTDPVQWQILDRAFHGHTTLVLVGDPKQAIYAFRGADVFSYLDARERAGRIATLARNWRSDAALTTALHALAGGATLGDSRIVVRPVSSQQPGSRLIGGQPAAPVRLRVLAHDPERPRPPSVQAIRPQIRDDLVADITHLLTGPVRLRIAAEARPVRPHDIAVLVRTNRQGEAIREALVSAGVPAVMLGATSVYDSRAARDWLTLLAACEQPRQRQVRAAALTCFLGWTFHRLAVADDAALTDLTVRVRAWSRLLAGRGVAALLEAISSDTRLPERLLAQSGGERLLTDIRHLAQVLHAAMTSGRLGVAALLGWLREQVAAVRAGVSDEGTRRLETDAAAVQVLTLHRSKGLEFPVVYLPEAWDRRVVAKEEGQLLLLHDAAGECVLDVGGAGAPGRSGRLATALAEAAGEELRLLYVGLTRAQSQVVTWWAPSVNTPTSPLHRLLARPPGAAEVAARYEVDRDPLQRSDLRAAGIAVEPLAARSAAPPGGAAVPPGPLQVRSFDRVLDLDWRRTSYTALTALAHPSHPSRSIEAGPGVGSEPEPTREDDEPGAAVSEATASEATDPALDQPSPMRLLPTGAQFGSAVHAVLELVDPSSASLPADLLEACAAAAVTAPEPALDPARLAEALHAVAQTPLGALAGQRRLCDFQAADRLTELAFELPLSGGDRPSGRVALGELGRLLRTHLAPGDPLAGYADAVERPGLAEQVLRGYLTGSMDAVLRVRDEGGPRYLVVDYKTNWLGGFDDTEGEPRLRLRDYTGDRMAAAMVAAHYPLQALLYSVALHRMLRWRQPGYRPDTHLGGVLYLFVRGMAGPETPVLDGVRCGVFAWQPPAALVTALSDLVAGGRR